MRTSLFALAFGALLLTGCADDLAGPDVAPLAGDMSAARATDSFGPTVDEDAMSALFSAWSGTDGVYAFDFVLEQAPIAPDLFEAPAEVRFIGKGSYERHHLDRIENPTPCSVVGQYEDGVVSFTIFDENDPVAHAEGALAADLASLDVKVKYADGTTKAMSFKRVAKRSVAAD